MTRNCIIWPENKRTEANPCFIHDFERERLGIGGEFNVEGHTYDNFLLLIDGHISFRPGQIDMENHQMQIEANFEEVRRRGQPLDKGGYYLDPQEIV